MDLLKQLRRFRLVEDARGLSTVEYVIILALIAAFAVGTWSTFGENVNRYIAKASADIDDKLSAGR